MASQLRKIENTAMKLTPREKGLLIRHLIQSLERGQAGSNPIANDGGCDESEEGLDEFWIPEVKKRYALYKSGDISSKPVSQALTDARMRLKNDQ